MSKGQINYLLALATLVVAWLFFHTVYSHSARTDGRMSPGGRMFAASQGFPNSARMWNTPQGMRNVPQGMQNVSQPPNINELLRNQARSQQARPAPGGMPPFPEAPQKDKEAKS